MFNRTAQVRSTKLQGQQLGIVFPRRGRPTKKRRLEEVGQMCLHLQPCAAQVEKTSSPRKLVETFDDLQMTFPVRPPTEARLCHLSGGELDQIQFLLGHGSIQTTERYLGCKQKLQNAVDDRLGIEPDVNC